MRLSCWWVRSGLPDRREIFCGFVSFESTSSTSMVAIVNELVDWMKTAAPGRMGVRNQEKTTTKRSTWTLCMRRERVKEGFGPSFHLSTTNSGVELQHQNIKLQAKWSI